MYPLVLDVLGSTRFLYFAFPLLSAFAGVGLKYVSRNDQYSSFTKEDMAVGLDLILTASLLYVALTADRVLALTTTKNSLADAREALSKMRSKEPTNEAAKDYLQHQETMLSQQAQDISQQLSLAFLIVLLLVVALWSVSTLVRKRGWKSNTEMHPVYGIAIPLLIGVMALMSVMVLATN
jgi:hypothetical protein